MATKKKTKSRARFTKAAKSGRGKVGRAAKSTTAPEAQAPHQ